MTRSWNSVCANLTFHLKDDQQQLYKRCAFYLNMLKLLKSGCAQI